MRCPKCKAVIKDNVNGCPECGYKEPDDVSSIDLSIISSLNKEKDQILPNGYPRHYYHHDGKKGIFAIFDFFKRAFVFSGVSARIEYWTQQLVLMIFYIMFLVSRSNLIKSNLNPAQRDLNLYYISMAVILICFIPAISATVRRLHDAGFSGLWYLLTFIPGAGSSVVFVMTLLPFKRNENNRPYEKKATMKIRLEDKVF